MRCITSSLAVKREHRIWKADKIDQSVISQNIQRRKTSWFAGKKRSALAPHSFPYRCCLPACLVLPWLLVLPVHFLNTRCHCLSESCFPYVVFWLTPSDYVVHVHPSDLIRFSSLKDDLRSSFILLTFNKFEWQWKSFTCSSLWPDNQELWLAICPWLSCKHVSDETARDNYSGPFYKLPCWQLDLSLAHSICLNSTGTFETWSKSNVLQKYISPKFGDNLVSGSIQSSGWPLPDLCSPYCRKQHMADLGLPHFILPPPHY